MPRSSKKLHPRQNDVAGDGTTTATVLAQAMVHEGMKNLAAGANPIILRKGMKKATDVAVEAIKNMSQTISGKKQIANVASISASDETVGQLVADAMEKVSKDGVITVEESKTMHTELDLVEGMQFDRGYVSAYMSTDMEKNGSKSGRSIYPDHRQEDQQHPGNPSITGADRSGRSKAVNHR
mgnify:CR=1 FL=1